MTQEQKHSLWEIIKAILIFAIGWPIVGFLIAAVCVGIASIWFPVSIFGNTIAIGGFLGACLNIYYFYKKKHVEINWGSVEISKRSSLVGWIFLLCLAIIGIDSLSDLVDIELPDELQDIFDTLSTRPDGILDVCLLAPIGEELCFRGFILRHLMRIFKNPWTPILISAFLFGLVHGNIAQFIFAFYAGVLMGWLAYRTNSLIPSILLHILNNTASTMVSWIPGSEDADFPLWWTFLIAAISIALLIFVVRRLRPLM